MSDLRINPFWYWGVCVALMFGAAQNVHEAHAGQRVVGELTKNEPAKNRIEVDGFVYVLSSNTLIKRAGRTAFPIRLENVKPGQTVMIEVDRGRVTTLTLIEGSVPN